MRHPTRKPQKRTPSLGSVLWETSLSQEKYSIYKVVICEGISKRQCLLTIGLFFSNGKESFIRKPFLETKRDNFLSKGNSFQPIMRRRRSRSALSPIKVLLAACKQRSHELEKDTLCLLKLRKAQLIWVTKRPRIVLMTLHIYKNRGTMISISCLCRQ